MTSRPIRGLCAVSIAAAYMASSLSNCIFLSTCTRKTPSDGDPERPCARMSRFSHQSPGGGRGSRSIGSSEEIHERVTAQTRRVWDYIQRLYKVDIRWPKSAFWSSATISPLPPFVKEGVKKSHSTPTLVLPEAVKNSNSFVTPVNRASKFVSLENLIPAFAGMTPKRTKSIFSQLPLEGREFLLVFHMFSLSPGGRGWVSGLGILRGNARIQCRLSLAFTIE